MASKMNVINQLRTILLGSTLVVAPMPFEAEALPSEGRVTSGAATISSSGSQTTINQSSNNAVLQWGSFNVQSNESVQFNQPSATSATLNRILDQNPSQIMGQVNANGQIFLMNANGIIFGSGSKVNAAGLFATTHNISNENFMSGNYTFSRVGNGSIINQGVITAASGGFVGLAADRVDNQGVVMANMGSVSMSSGQAVTLDFNGDGLMQFAVSGQVLENIQNHATAVSNSGTITAAGGQVVLTANTAVNVFNHAVNNAGVISATRTSDSGGLVQLTSDAGTVVHEGTIDVSGTNTTGGTVHVLGEQVGLFDDAYINASGDTGGGTVLVGGEYQGQGDIQTAEKTYVAADALVEVNALDSGNGGRAIFWANDVTRFYGSVEARAGPNGGDGGFIEISGKDSLIYRGSVDATSAFGQTGSVLFDPNYIVIATGGSDDIATNDTFSDGAGDTVTFSPSSLVAALNGGTVTLQANSDITFNNDVDSSAGSANHLYLQAGRDIFINADVTIRGYFNATANDSGADGNRADGTGDIIIASGKTLSTTDNYNVLLTIDSGGISAGTVTVFGDIALTGGSSLTIDANDGAATDTGDINIQGAITSGTGAITLNSDDAIYFGSTGGITSTSGLVTLNADADSDNTSTAVITMNNGADINAGSGKIDLHAEDDITIGILESSSGTGTDDIKVVSDAGAISGADANTIEIVATTGEFNASAFDGIDLDTNVTDLDVVNTSGSGAITIDEFDGITVDLLKQSHTTNTTTITLTAGGLISISEPGSPSEANSTIYHAGASGGDISITATGSGDIQLNDYAVFAGSGDISITAAGDDILGGTSDDIPDIVADGNVSMTAKSIGDTNPIDIGGSTSTGTLTLYADTYTVGANTDSDIQIDQITDVFDAYSVQLEDSSSSVNVTFTAFGQNSDVFDINGGESTNIINDVTLNNGNSAFSYDLDQAGASLSINKIYLSQKDVTLTAEGNITVNDVSSAGVRATSGGDISIASDGTEHSITNNSLILGGSVTLSATNDVTINNETDAGYEVYGLNTGVSITADSNNNNNNSGGKITIADAAVVNAGGATITMSADEEIQVGQIITTSNSDSAISLTSKSNYILDGGDAGTDISAVNGRAVLTALGVGPAGLALETDLAKLKVTNTSASWGTAISNAGALEINEITQTSTTSAGINITAGGTITIDSGASPLNAITLSGSGDIVLDANGVSADIILNDGLYQSGSGDITLTADNGVTGADGAGDLTTTTGNISVTADADGVDDGSSGLLTMLNGMVWNAGSGTITLSADETLTVGALSTSSESASAVSLTSTSANIAAANDDVTEVTATGGRLVVTAETGIALDIDTARVNTTTTSGATDLDADNAFTMADGDVIDGGTGAITINATSGNAVIGRVVTSDDINITASAGITDAGDTGGEDIDGASGTVTLSAASGIGSAGALEIDAATLSATNTGASGNIALTETDGVIVSALKQTGASSGNVSLTTSTGNITLGDSTVVVNGGILTLDAAGNILSGDDDGNAEIDADGSVYLTALDIGATSDTIEITGDTSGTDVLVVSSDGTSTNGIKIDVLADHFDSVLLTLADADADVNIALDPNGINDLVSITGSSDTSTVNATTVLSDVGSFLFQLTDDETTIHLDGFTSGGVSGFVSDGNIEVDGTVTGGANNLYLIADYDESGAGSIDQTGSGLIDMNGGTLSLTAGDGIGASGTSIETEGLTNVAATTEAGGVFIDNSTSSTVNVTSSSEVTLGAITFSAVDGISSAGDVDLDNTGALTVTAAKQITAGGTGTAITIDSAGITLNAGADANTTTLVQTGAGTVTLTSTGDNDINLDEYAIAVDSGTLTLTSARDIDSISLNTADNFTFNGDLVVTAKGGSSGGDWLDASYNGTAQSATINMIADANTDNFFFALDDAGDVNDLALTLNFANGYSEVHISTTDSIEGSQILTTAPNDNSVSGALSTTSNFQVWRATVLAGDVTINNNASSTSPYENVDVREYTTGTGDLTITSANGDINLFSAEGSTTAGEDDTGNITFTATAGDIAINKAMNARGVVTLDANSTSSVITVNSAINSNAANVNILSNDDVIFGSGGDITTSNGDVVITADFDDGGSDSGALTMADGTVVDAGSGTITLSADENVVLGRLFTSNGTGSAVSVTSTSEAIYDGGVNGGEEIDAAFGTVTLSAETGGIGTGGNGALEIDAASVTATVDKTGSGNGIHLAETNTVTINSLSLLDGTSSSDIDFSAGGTITVSAGSDVNDATINNDGAGTIDITTTSGDLALGNFAIDINTGKLTLDVAANITAGSGTTNEIQADGSVEMTAVDIGGTNSLDMTGDTSGTDTLTVTNDGDTTNGIDIDMGAAHFDAVVLSVADANTAVNIDLSGSDDIAIVGTNATTNTLDTIVLNNNNVNFTYSLTESSTNAAVKSVVGGSATISITSAGGITDGDNGETVASTTGSLTLAASTGIGSADALQVTAGTLSATNSGGSGNIALIETDGVTVSALKQTGASSGSVSLTTNAGNITLGDSTVLVNDGALSLTSAADILTGDDDTNAEIDADGNITLTALNIGTGSDALEITGDGVADSTLDLNVLNDDSTNLVDIDMATAQFNLVDISTADSNIVIDIDLANSDSIDIDGGDNTSTLEALVLNNSNVGFTYDLTETDVGADFGIAIKSVVTTSADVDIQTADGAITDAGTTEVTTSGTLTLTATAGIGSGNAIETDVGTLSATNSGTSGHIQIDETDAVTVSALRQTNGSATGDIILDSVGLTLADTTSGNEQVNQAGSGDVTITSTSFIQMGDYNINVESGDLTLAATGGVLFTLANNSDPEITADGDVSLTGTGISNLDLAGDDSGNSTLTLSIVSGGTGAITLDINNDQFSAYNITQVIDTGDVDIDLTSADEITMTGESNDVNFDTVDLAATDASLTYLLNTSGDALTIDNIDMGTAALDIRNAGGSITTTASGGGITAESGASVTLNADGATSDVVVNDGITTVAGSVTLQADRSVTFGADGDVATANGNVIVNADADGDNTAAAVVTMADGALINAGAGTIAISAVDEVTLGRLLTTNSTDSAVTVTSSAADIQDAGAADDSGTEDIEAAGRVVLSAVTGIGVADGLEIEAGSIDVTNTGTSGNITLNETGAVTVYNLSQSNASATGNIELNAAGTITVDTGSQQGAATAISGLNTTAISLTSTGASSDIVLNDRISSASGNITLTAGNDISGDANGDITSTSGDLEVNADASGGLITMDDDMLWNAGSGAIDLSADDNITLGGLLTTNAGDSAVTIDSVNGAILDAGATYVDVVAASGGLVITAKDGVGHSNGLETTVAKLNIENETAGNIDINETDSVAVVQMTQTTADNIDLTVASGAITDGGDDQVDFTTASGTLTLSATTGIGSADALETTVGTLNATNSGASGNILITETNDLTVSALNQIGASDGNVTLVSAAGSITLSQNSVSVNDGTLTVTAAADILASDDGGQEVGEIDADGDIYLTAQGIAATNSLDISGDVGADRALVVTGLNEGATNSIDIDVSTDQFSTVILTLADANTGVEIDLDTAGDAGRVSISGGNDTSTVSANTVLTDIGSLLVNLTDDEANIHLDGFTSGGVSGFVSDGDIQVDGTVTGGANNLYLIADYDEDGAGSIDQTGSGVIAMSGGTLSLTAGDGIGASGTSIETDGLTNVAATTEAGGVFIDNSTSSTVNVTSSSEVTLGSITFSAVDGITSAGDVDLDNTGALSVTAAKQITAGGTGTAITIDAAGITLNAGTNADTATVAQTGTGTITLTSTGDNDISLANNSIDIADGVLAIASEQDITVTTDGGNEIQADGNVTLTAESITASNGGLDISGDGDGDRTLTVNALNESATNSINIDAVSDQFSAIVLNVADANTSFAITQSDDEENTDSIAVTGSDDTSTLVATLNNTGISFTYDLTEIDTNVALGAITLGGTTGVRSTNDISVAGTLVGGANTLYLVADSDDSSAGSINYTSGSLGFSSGALSLNAYDGIGSNSSRLSTSGLTDFAATTETGGVYITNSDSSTMDVNAVSGTSIGAETYSTVTGVTATTSGDIKLVNSGAIDVNNVITAISGSVDIDSAAFTLDAAMTAANDGTVTITNSGLADLNAALNSEGTITFDGTGAIDLGVNLAPSDTGAGIVISNSILNLDADRSLTTINGVVTLDEVNTDTNNDHVLTISTGSGAVTIEDNVGVNGGNVLGGLSITTSGKVDFSGSAATIDVGAENVDINSAALDLDGAVNVNNSGTFTATNSGDADVNAAIVSAGALSFAGAGDIDLAADLSASSISIANSALTLSDAVQMTASSGNIALGQTIDGTQDLTLSATSGTVQLSGALGNSNALNSLTVDSDVFDPDAVISVVNAIDVDTRTLELDGGTFNTTTGGVTISNTGLATIEQAINATGAVLFDSTGLINLKTDINGSSVTVNSSDISLGYNGSMTASTGDIALSGDVDGARTFALTANNGEVEINGAIGSDTALSSLTVTAATFDPNAAITTSGNLTVSSTNTELSAAQALTSTGGDIDLTGAIDGNQALTLSATSGEVELNSAVGSDTALSALTIDSDLLDVNAAISVAGNIDIDTNDLTLDGALTSTNSGTITVSSADTADINQAITSAGALLLDDDGAINLSANLSGSGIDITDSKITLDGASVWTASANNIDIVDTIDGAQALTLSATSGEVELNDALGATTALSALTIDSDLLDVNAAVSVAGNIDIDTNDLTLDGALTSTNSGTITVSSADTADINQAITSAGALLLDDDGAINLSANLSGAGIDVTDSKITLDGTSVWTASANNIDVVDTIDGAQALTLTASSGEVELNAAVGGSTALSSLTVNAATFDPNAAITTSGNLTVSSTNTELSGSQVLTSTGGNIDLTGAIDGNQALTLSATSGEVELNSAVGSDTALSALTIDSDLLDVNAAVSVAGNIDIDTNDLTLDGALTSTNSGTITVSSADTADINQAITSAGALLLDDDGAINLSANLSGSGIDITDSKITLDGTSVWTASANNIDVVDTIDGAQALTLTASSGEVELNSAVGGSTALSALTVDSSLFDINAAVNVGGDVDVDTTTMTLDGALTTTNSGTITISNAGLATLSSDIVSDGNFTQDGAGAVNLEADITASNANISFAGAVTTASAANLDTSTSGAITFDSSLAVNADTLLDSDSIVFNGGSSSVTGSSSLTLLPASTSSKNITLGTSGDFNIISALNGFDGDVVIGGNLTGYTQALNGSLTTGSGLNIDGDLYLIADSISFGDVTADNVYAVATNGDMTAASGTNITAASSVQLGVNGSIGTAGSPLTANGSSVEYWQTANQVYLESNVDTVSSEATFNDSVLAQHYFAASIFNYNSADASTTREALKEFNDLAYTTEQFINELLVVEQIDAEEDAFVDLAGDDHELAQERFLSVKELPALPFSLVEKSDSDSSLNINGEGDRKGPKEIQTELDQDEILTFDERFRKTYLIDVSVTPDERHEPRVELVKPLNVNHIKLSRSAQLNLPY